MTTPYIGEIRPFGFNFVPYGWAACDGQTLPISEYSALFSLIGTIYGGDGVTTFKLPDLRGRVPVHPGSGSYPGEMAGAERVSLTAATMPGHSHTVMASADLAASTSPSGKVMGAKGRGGASVYGAATNLTTLAPGAVGIAGQGAPHENMQPSLVVNFCIALFGIYPSRN